MATFLIREENIDRLDKKLAAIQKKCKATHCSFTYKKTGEHFKEDESGNIYKYIEVEVEGTAQYNGWRFVATLDHHEGGNVIRAFDTELVIPEKYKSCGPTCEHCNKIRSRKDTYLIYNDEKSEFKQVGKSCLQEFTNGLSSEEVAFFCSIYEKCEEGGSYSGPNDNRYIPTERILRYAFECFKHWGYQNAEAERSTRERVLDYYTINRVTGPWREKLKSEMKEVGFDPESEYAVETTKAALEWINNIDGEELNKNDYLRNLRIICKDEFIDWRSIGILVSLTITYARHIKQVEEYNEKEKKAAIEKKSGYVGEVGYKLDFKVTSFELVSSWDSMYGTTWLYKFFDEAGNTFIWYSSKPIDNEEKVVSIKGTVKDHIEFREVKQTVLTRCKVTHKPEEQEESQTSNSNEIEKAVDEFLSYCNS